jgi:hypothetical protein
VITIYPRVDDKIETELCPNITNKALRRDCWQSASYCVRGRQEDVAMATSSVVEAIQAECNKL